MTVYIRGQRVVRIRRHRPAVGPFRLDLYMVTDTNGRKNLAGINFLTYEDASRWVLKQGWRHIGRQVTER